MVGKRAPLAERFWAKVRKTESCWLWTGCANNKGYALIRPSGTEPKKLVHRISYIMAYGPISDAVCVLHRCDTPLCVRPDHLFLGTKADNNQDMKTKGRYHSVLTKRQEALCESSPKSAKQLAREWGVDKGVILRRRSWVYEHRNEVLSDTQVRMCRRSKKSACQIARELGVSHHVILDIRHGRTYRGVK